MEDSQKASIRVLEWIEDYMKAQRLGPGDALPSELEIARDANAGRSSVREALTVLKALGIIHSRRKGGITIVRDPVLLELRHFFVERYESQALFDDVMEFRAAMEWGFGSLAFSRIKPDSVRKLREIVEGRLERPTEKELAEAEVSFHTCLTEACGNRLASIFAHLYPPIFLGNAKADGGLDRKELDRWTREHIGMVEALERKDVDGFLKLLREHTHGYMRDFGNRRKGVAS